jgi:hypothetical protein
MIRGLDKFKDHFKHSSAAFVLIGGVACHEWLASQGLPFRATKDIDIVLVVESVDQSFIAGFWKFIEEGQYDFREKSDGGRELYRFSKPKDDTYPAIIEIFSRKPEKMDLAAGQRVIPITIDENSASLSALLLDDAYYSLVKEQRIERPGLPFVAPAALIPLKARAWLDLTKRKRAGQKVDTKDIDKHRSDVFRIAATLPGEPGQALSNVVLDDLRAFLGAFPEDNPEWPAILASLQTTFSGTELKPQDLINALRTYFRID